MDKTIKIADHQHDRLRETRLKTGQTFKAIVGLALDSLLGVRKSKKESRNTNGK